jgi:hypothetical protein
MPDDNTVNDLSSQKFINRLRRVCIYFLNADLILASSLIIFLNLHGKLMNILMQTQLCAFLKICKFVDWSMKNVFITFINIQYF